MNAPEDIQINIKIKLAALWASVMFCYVYGDFFELFVPGHIETLMKGVSGLGTTTPGKLLGFAILMSIPSVMIFLSVILPARINRWANIITGIFFTAIMLLVAVTSTGEWMLFYIYLAVVEMIITSLIVWFAWKWPRQ
jgi:hypothetical protein